MGLRFTFAFALGLAACTFDFDNTGPTGGAGGSGATTSDGGSGATGGASGGGGAQSDGGGPSGGGGMGGGAGGDGGIGGMPQTDACEELGGQCLAVPNGFTGPYRLSDPATGCGTGDLVEEGGRWLNEDSIVDPPATCGCSCSVPADPQCAPVNVDIDQTSQNCSAIVGIGNSLDPGDCWSPTYKSFTYGFNNGSGPLAMCMTDGAMAQVPPYAFATPVATCDDNLLACSDTGDPCVLPGQYCVISKTASQCEGAFPVLVTQLVTDADIDDTRECVCGCGPVSGTCSPEFQIFTATNCANPTNETDTGGCVSGPAQSTLKSMSYKPVFSGGSCGAPAHFPSGSASATTKAIVCCTN